MTWRHIRIGAALTHSGVTGARRRHDPPRPEDPAAPPERLCLSEANDRDYARALRAVDEREGGGLAVVAPAAEMQAEAPAKAEPSQPAAGEQGGAAAAVRRRVVAF